ncbi:DUF1080 domain-containing protein [Sphingobacterium sp. SGR-19]|uniref:3-keto-disaccharide hydrolase n=1 Tax=Sphingobacterium sp. SGR-19 TaxID=2710886 RepID=UPI0013ED997D|nr:DUF1080 domain-containing protein [Sphingobacterium sp. SGR-19]NGM67134.1 DUF1080 domain-containing protein [Sphingobacterium sp. SGR-19]
MNVKLSFLSALATGTILFACSSAGSKTTSSTDETLQPIQLFNGKDINDWTPKIRLHEVGENYANTFRVEDGLLKVRYDGYDDFNKQYGHLAYNKPYGYYLLRVEYRFVDEQVKGGEGWAWRNSGAMLHGQDPNTMLKEQDFPISVEGQFLGGDGKTERTTSNLCTPGTNVVINDELYTPHCISSSSRTYHGDEWVTADFLVLGDSLIQHILEGEVVMEYNKPQIGGGNVEHYDAAQKTDSKLLDKGFIYLQSESHPIDFRKVELYDLAPYKDNKAKLDEIIQKLL